MVSVQATWVAFLNTCRHSGDCPTTRRGPDCPSRFSVRLRTIAERIAEIAMLGLLLRTNNAIAGPAAKS